jgi:hypothetical protein
MMDPFVSVPTETAVRFAAVADPEPDEEPQAERSSAYGFLVRPPRLDHPLDDVVDR